jgi:hypothetical protein
LAFATEFGVILGGGIAQAYASQDQIPEEFIIATNTYPVIKTGLVAEYPITHNFSLIQEVLYSQKGAKQTITVDDQPVKFNLNYDLDYLEVPFLIKYRLLNIKRVPINSIVGFSVSYLLKAHYKLNGTVNIADDVLLVDDSYEIKDLDEFDYSLLYGLSTNLKEFGIPVHLEYRISLSWAKIEMPTFEGIDPVIISNQSQTLAISYKFYN